MGGGWVGASAKTSGAGGGVGFSASTGVSKTGKAWAAGRSTAGLEGALLPLSLGLEGGTMIDDKSWLDMAADRRWAWPLRGLVGWSIGEAMPLSDLVGLVFRTVMASPSRMLPPTNSLPPLRCPWPVGRVAASRGEFGAEGDRGGLRNMPSGPGVGGKEAPGLNENAGSAGDRAAAFPSSRVTCGAELRGSIADRGRLPAGLPTNEGADDDDGRAGKTK